MQTPGTSASMLSPIGYQNSSCGYCHNKSGSQSPKRFSYYASAKSLSPTFYQSLLDRGWRRSGSLLYKPDQRASCCPQYAIRLDSLLFHPSKDQRQVVNRFNKYVLGDLYAKEAARLYPLSRDHAKKRNTDFDLISRIHESEKERLKTPPDPAHGFTINLEPDNFTEEKYALFENYQRLVHHEPPNRISKPGFKNFLCNSPLPRSKVTLDGQERRLGSYHQCYRIDGKLVAIGVLDLLPQCVSAVYFMYHESVHQYGFGKLGALREIALAKEEGYKWWYAGFYIHSCVKMKYKGDYSPQYMLDPESYGWDPLDDDLRTKLDVRKYISLSSKITMATESTDPYSTEIMDLDGQKDNTPESDHDYNSDDGLPIFLRPIPGILTKEQLEKEIDIDHIKIHVQGQDAEAFQLGNWAKSNLDSTTTIKGIIGELAAAVGAELAREMVVTF